MAESLENLVEKFRQNLTKNIRKLEEESHEKIASLKAKHQQEIALLGDKEKVEREEFDAKQSQRRKDLMLKQHQEKEKLKSNYEKKLKATKENHMCANTPDKEVPECPVCLEPMDPPMRIFQCSNGHYLCEDCNNNKEIRSCPSCRQQIVGRNIGMEQAIQLMGEPTSDIPAWRQREVAQASGRGNVWECSACTFHNREDESICQMCGKIGVQTIVKESQNHLTRGNSNSMKSHKKEDHHGNIITISNKIEENQNWDRSNVKQMQKPNSKTLSINLFRQRKPIAQFPHNGLANSSKGNGNRLANSSKPNGIREEKLHCPCPPYCPNCLIIVKMENLR